MPAPGRPQPGRLAGHRLLCHLHEGWSIPGLRGPAVLLAPDRLGPAGHRPARSPLLSADAVLVGVPGGLRHRATALERRSRKHPPGDLSFRGPRAGGVVISDAARRCGYDERHWTTEDGHLHTSVPAEVPVAWRAHFLASGRVYMSGGYG